MAAPSKKKPLVKSDSKPVMGRPKIYTEEVIQQEADALINWIQDSKNTYIGQFAFQRGYDRQRISEFARDNKYFSDAYRQAIQWQENTFLHNALTRKWDSAFASKAMARVCRPEWKNSWDREEDKTEGPTTVIINKIEK